MGRQVLFGIVLVLMCVSVGLAATSSIQSITGTWYDGTESNADPKPNGIAQGAGRCKVTPGNPGSAVFISETNLAEYELSCKIHKAIPHGRALELVMSCIAEGTSYQEHRKFQVLDQTHLRVYSGSSDGFVLTRCPSSELNNAKNSESSNKASVSMPKSSAPEVASAESANRLLKVQNSQNDVPYHLTIGYEDEGKIEASEQACRSYVESITAWDKAAMEKGAQEVCAARIGHIEAYAKLQGDYRAMIETFSTDRRLENPGGRSEFAANDQGLH